MKIDDAKTRNIHLKTSNNSTENRVSVYSESYKGEYYNINTDKLIPYKNQSRKTFDKKSLEELAATIRSYGIRQPLTVLPSKNHDGKYEIVSGERRWRAALFIHLNKVPCIILQNEDVAEEVALVENVQRKDLHPLELMKGLKNLLNRKVCKNQQEISDKIGLSRTTVVEILALSKLPLATQDMLLEKQIKSRALMRLLLHSPEQDHKSIIGQEYKKIELKNSVKTPKETQRKKVLSIYLQSDTLVFKRTKDLFLNNKQILEMKKYINSLESLKK